MVELEEYRKYGRLPDFLFLAWVRCIVLVKRRLSQMSKYDEIKKKMLVGWNTWNVRSMTSYVLMPQGLSINIGIKEYEGADFLGEALLGRMGDRPYAQRMNPAIEEVIPGAHNYNGSFTSLELRWKGIEVRIETTTVDEQLYIKVTPIKNQKKPATIVFSAAMLWNKQGLIYRGDKGDLTAVVDKTYKLNVIGEQANDKQIPITTPYYDLVSNQSLYFYTGAKQSLDALEQLIIQKRTRYERCFSRYEDKADHHRAIQEALAWNMIYDPSKDRIITPVSRTWSVEWGGYVKHCWDMYFNALMYSTSQKELAYISAIEMTKEHTEEGFVPNCVAANGFVTYDRSQPPVGSLVVLELFNKYHDEWFIEMLFEDLLNWNMWYFNNRQVAPGILGWGSRPYEPNMNNHWEMAGVGEFYGAAMESGLDNSPMYDNVPMNPETHTMVLGDVGLTSLYIADCEALITMAKILKNKEAEADLIKCKNGCIKGMKELWHEKSGIFLNYRSDLKKYDDQLSPTNFYPLLTDAVTKEQASRMVKEHLLNSDEFWGEWVIPSISKNNPAFLEQDYWRGRIWAPMNLLVYLGLKNSGQNQVAKELAIKSGDLIMKEWQNNRHVHENYCALTGDGCNVENSEKFYSWGALLSYIYIDL